MKLAINHATLLKTPIEPFIKAIAKAGFKGVELRRDETFLYLKDHAVEDLNLLLRKNNLECITFNAIELFSLCPESEFQRIVDYTERLMNIGNQIGCETIIAVPSFINDTSLDNSKIISYTVDRLKILAKLAENYNFKVGFEPLGFPNCSVRKIDLALKIIEHEDLPEMGLIIDTFHFFLGGHSIEDLDLINLKNLWLIHMNDSIKKPIEQLQDSDRVLPLEGFFELDAFVKKLKIMRYDKWISIELFNEEMWKQDPEIVAQKTMISLKKLI